MGRFSQSQRLQREKSITASSGGILPKSFSLITTLSVLAFSLISVESSSFAQSATFFVSPAGLDSNPGTQAAPWRSVQKAANSVPPGSTVYVRGGVYNEMIRVGVSGSASAGFTTFQSYPGETAVIDGSGLTVPSGSSGLVLIWDQNYVRWMGFELRNFRSTQPGTDPTGIGVFGTSNHVELVGNRVHHIETGYNGQSGGNGHGISVLGTSTTQPISDLVIEGNEVYQLRTGSSESVTLNGNVTNFRVTNNVIHDNNNIGIDMAGFYGVCATPECDQVRNGVCSGNRVYNIDSSHNPAYGGDFNSGGGGIAADGIYVDGGRDIMIENNVVYRANIGIELASEHQGRATSNITVRDNVVYQSSAYGIAIGGYDTGRGVTQGCKILNNTLFQNNTLGWSDGAELYVQFDTRNNLVENNVFYGSGNGHFIHNRYAQNVGNVVDYNLYFSNAGAASARFLWKGQSFTGVAAYQGATGNDAHSVFANPQFAGEASFDLHLAIGSPALGRGLNGVNLGATAMSPPAATTPAPPPVAPAAPPVTVAPPPVAPAPPAVVTPVIPDLVFTQTAEADTNVRSGVHGGETFGTATVLEVKEGTNPDSRRNAYLRFSIANISGPVQTAKLRVWGANNGPSPKPAAAFTVASTDWDEASLSWNQRDAAGPAIGAQLDGNKSVPPGQGQWVEWDVTSYVRQARTAGAGKISLAIKAASASSDLISFSSREAAANPPTLVIETGP
jgi:parallel beta-helix repeat protein